MLKKIIELIKNPSRYYDKVIPYIKSKFFRTLRSFYEFFGIDKLSKPYPGHDKLKKYFNYENGFFVECGGNDGYVHDPTYYFEKIKKWNGIIVEPLPIYSLCKLDRNKSVVYNYALVADDFEGGKISLIDCNLMSVVEDVEDSEDWALIGAKMMNIKPKKIQVPTITIQNILDNFFSTHGQRNIDLMVIDVEGYEVEVLKGMNFDKYRPKNLLIEIHGEDRKTQVESLIEKYYDFVDQITIDDRLYSLKSDS